MSTTPWPVRAARKYGQSTVLYAALALSAPGEFSLATMAGWSPRVAWLMPFVMSLYAAISASVATAQKDAVRRVAGTSAALDAQRRYRSAARGALLALVLATAAQITDHLMTATVVGPRVWVLVAVSSVPPLVAAHVLHIDPPSTADEPERAETSPAEAPQEPHTPVSGPPTPPADEETQEPPREAYTPVLVSYRDAAEELGLSEITIRGWANSGTVVKYDGPTSNTRRVDLLECRAIANGRVAAGA